MAEAEKRMAGNYEVKFGYHVGDREVVFGIDPASDKPFFCALYYTRFEIIQTREVYEDCVASDNYVEIAEQFAAYVQNQCQKVREKWAEVDVPRVRITEEMCCPHSAGQNLNGKIVAIKPSYLRPEYQSADRQLFLLVDGYGTYGSNQMATCDCINLYTGESDLWRRHEIMGEVRQKYLPGWAKERAAAIREKLAEKARERKASVPDR